MRQGKRVSIPRLAAALAVSAILVCLGLSGCGEFFTPVNNHPGGTGTTSSVYVLHTGGTLAEYSLSSGVLTALSGSPITLPVAGTATITSITVAPNNAFLYVGTSEGVFLYTINSDGSLTEGNNDTIVFLSATVTHPVASMVVDSTDSWLIMAYQDSTEIDALPIDPKTGLPTSTQNPPPNQSLTASTTAPQLAISPANAQVFVALGAGGTDVLTFNPKNSNPLGTSEQIPTTVSNPSDTAVAVDSTSTYLFITEANGTTANSSGTLRLRATAKLGGSDLDDIDTGVGPTGVLAALRSAVNYIYVTNGSDGTISGYSLDTTAQKFTALGTTVSAKSPIAILEDSSKSYILDVGSTTTPNLDIYGFDSTTAGALDLNQTKTTINANPTQANGLAVTH